MAQTKTGAGDLVLHATDQGGGPVFERFFAGYDRAFVLPDEKEDRAGLSACLALNHGAAHARLVDRFGRFRELCLVAETADGRLIGGANFIAMPAAGATAPPMVTANLNYVYVDRDFRGRGYLRWLLDAVSETAAELFGERRHALVFIEQNDPFLMSPEDYARDTKLTGVDQFARLRIWARLGARVVDFPYVQPALSADQQPDHCLIYSVLGTVAPELDPAILHGHLSRFFGISVLKGRPLASDPAAAAQLARLEAMAAARENIALLDPGPLLDRAMGREPAATAYGKRPAGFREALSRC
jgi:GNAT superfamily N-acetyltransferase